MTACRGASVIYKENVFLSDYLRENLGDNLLKQNRHVDMRELAQKSFGILLFDARHSNENLAQ